jgi:hypothetical protein
MATDEIVFEVKESPEGGYEARALGHAIFTQADTLEALRVAVRDAVLCHFDPPDRPRLIDLHIVKDELIPVETTA